MSEHDHHHHDHDHSDLSETELRVRALESILTEKGYIEPAALDAIVQAYETKIGPHNGAQVVAKAWTDPAFKQAHMGICGSRCSIQDAMVNLRSSLLRIQSLSPFA